MKKIARPAIFKGRHSDVGSAVGKSRQRPARRIVYPIGARARRAAAGLALASAALLTTSAPTQAQTDVLVSNVGQMRSGSLGLDTHEGAQAFTTGANSDGYTVTSVGLDLSSGSTSTNFTVGVWTNSDSNLPGTSLGTLTPPGSLTTPGVNEFTTSGIVLAANTTYWVVVDSDGGGSTQWEGTAAYSEDFTSASGWSIADESYDRAHDGSTWSSFDEPFKLRVNGPAINSPPAITTMSPQSVAENMTAVVTLAATDTDTGDTLTWSKNGGADASAFALTTAGVLSFASAPNFEDPTDTGTDNGYEVTVRVSDGTAPADLRPDRQRHRRRRATGPARRTRGLRDRGCDHESGRGLDGPGVERRPGPHRVQPAIPGGHQRALHRWPAGRRRPEHGDPGPDGGHGVSGAGAGAQRGDAERLVALGPGQHRAAGT